MVVDHPSGAGHADIGVPFSRAEDFVVSTIPQSLSFLAILLGSLFLNTALATDIPASFKEHMRSFEEVAESSVYLDESKELPQLTNAYIQHIKPYARNPNALQLLSDDDLDRLLKNIGTTAYRSANDLLLADMKAVFSSLHARNSLNESSIRIMHMAYLYFRKLDRANALIDEHPDLPLEKPPNLVRMDTRRMGAMRIWSLAKTPNSLEESQFTLDNDTKVIVVTHPLCRFSRAAYKEIATHPDVRAAMAGNSLWIVPPGPTFALRSIAYWNKHHPDAPMVVMADRNEWPMLDTVRTTPTFYFFKNGKLRSKIQGWPSGGQLQELRRSLNDLGLTD